MPKTHPTFRSVSHQDLEVLVEGNLRLARETESLHLNPDIVRRGVEAVLKTAGLGRYYVLEADGRVAVQLLVTYEWSDWRNGTVWWIQSVYCWPEFRGRGLFRQLFDLVEEEARAMGAAGLRLYVDRTNEHAQNVYRRLGMNGEHYRLYERMF